MWVAIVGIVISLAVLIVLAYRGMPVIIAAPIASLVAVLFSSQVFLAEYTQVFMTGLVGFLKAFFPIFLTGAIFGVLMSVTGFATAIAVAVMRVLGARSAIAATVVTAGLMTYGGISVFIVAFVMYPLARELFRAADVPRRLIPGAIALGIGTFTLTALPGTPAIQNVIPATFFGTDIYAAPIIGVVGSVFMFAGGLAYLEYRRKSLVGAGEHFSSPESAPVREESIANEAQFSGGTTTATATATAVHPGIAAIPLIVVTAVNFLCTLVIFPYMVDWGFLEAEKYGGATESSVQGVWAVLIGVTAGILAILALNIRRFDVIKKGVIDGITKSMLPALSVASEVGYGAVIAGLAAFAVIRDAVIELPANALWTSVVANNVTSGITGSSSGGMSIALAALGDQLKAQALEEGIGMDVMHRLTAMAAGGLDTLPHSGAVITVLIVCNLTHRQSYRDLGVVTIVVPLIVTIALVAVMSVVLTGSL